MKIKINFWAFISSLICIVLFFTAISFSEAVDFTVELIYIHPLIIVLGLSLLTFLFGLIGFSAAINWRLLLRSILTVIISFTLSAITIYIAVLAGIFKFT